MARSDEILFCKIYNLQFTKLPEHLHFASLSNHSISRSFVTNKRLLPNWLSCFIILFTSLKIWVISSDIFTSSHLWNMLSWGTSIALQNGTISQCVSEIENHIKYFPTPPLSPGTHCTVLNDPYKHATSPILFCTINSVFSAIISGKLFLSVNIKSESCLHEKSSVFF